MNLSDFAKSRGKEPQTVSRYIKRHEKEFKGHIKIVGKAKVLDAVAIERLSNQYPLPPPIHVVEDTETQKKLVEAQETIIGLQQMLLAAQSKLADLEVTAYRQQLLEEDIAKKDEEIADLKEQLKAKPEKSGFWSLFKKSKKP